MHSRHKQKYMHNPQHSPSPSFPPPLTLLWVHILYPTPLLALDTAAGTHPTPRYYPIFNSTLCHSPQLNLPFNPTPLPPKPTPNLVPHPNLNPSDPTPPLRKQDNCETSGFAF